MDDPYAAYCLDTACATFGRNLEAELESVEGKNKKEVQTKKQRLLAKWLGQELKYRDPVKAGVVSKE